jgi:hypothetical protein
MFFVKKFNLTGECGFYEATLNRCQSLADRAGVCKPDLQIFILSLLLPGRRKKNSQAEARGYQIKTR